MRETNFKYIYIYIYIYNLQLNFQKEWGSTGPQFSEEGCWERGADFFQWEGLQFIEGEIT